MGFELLNTVDVIEVMENYISRQRPPEDISELLDLTYTIDNQSVILQEVRPSPVDDSIKSEYAYAKATLIKSSNKWKIYWMRANRKWDLYKPEPEVKTLKEFLNLVDEDAFGCFHG